MSHVIGLDLGTSALKALLTGPDGAPLATASVPLALSRPRPGWSEQPPEAWWQAARSALAALRGQAPEEYARTRAIGLSGQMHAAVLLGADLRPLCPAILWDDARAEADCARLLAACPDLARLAGVRPMAGLTAPKLLWLAREEPGVLERLAHVVGAKDYVRLHLTGELATDISEAAGTLWLDQAARAWSPAAVAASGLRPEHLPRLLEGCAPAGRLRPSLAAGLGLQPSVVVAAGAGDAAAGAVGLGAVAAGDAFVSLGTACQMIVVDDAYRPAPETLLHTFAHAVPGRWYQMAALLNGMGGLAWLARVTGREEAVLLRLASRRRAERPDSPAGPLFSPYLRGERTPHDDPGARGLLAGLQAACDAADLALAVVEGLALSLREARDCLAGVRALPAELGLTGGGALSDLVAQEIADAVELPVLRYGEPGVGPALGAARLARLALDGGPVEEVAAKPRPVARFLPAAGRAAHVEARSRAFRALYRGTRDILRRA